MSHEIHPSMHGMQARAREAMLDRVPGHAGREQLRSRDDPVLALGEPGDGPIARLGYRHNRSLGAWWAERRVFDPL